MMTHGLSVFIWAVLMLTGQVWPAYPAVLIPIHCYIMVAEIRRPKHEFDPVGDERAYWGTVSIAFTGFLALALSITAVVTLVVP